MPPRELPTEGSVQVGNQEPQVYWEKSRLYIPESGGKRVRIPNTCNNPVTCTFPFIVKKVQQAQQRREAKQSMGDSPPKKALGLPVPPRKPKDESVFELTEIDSYVPFTRWKRTYEIAPGLMPKMATQDDPLPP